jgi:hypothetical protein
MFVRGVELAFQNVDRIPAERLTTDLDRPHGICVVCHYEQHMAKKKTIYVIMRNVWSHVALERDGHRTFLPYAFNTAADKCIVGIGQCFMQVIVFTSKLNTPTSRSENYLSIQIRIHECFVSLL